MDIAPVEPDATYFSTAAEAAVTVSDISPDIKVMYH